jgi:hypothetical protein
MFFVKENTEKISPSVFFKQKTDQATLAWYSALSFVGHQPTTIGRAAFHIA